MAFARIRHEETPHNSMHAAATYIDMSDTSFFTIHSRQGQPPVFDVGMRGSDDPFHDVQGILDMNDLILLRNALDYIIEENIKKTS